MHVGTLIMVSKLFDGVSDMFFGTVTDKTKSRLGKSRPWMLYAYIGCPVTLVANFAIPESLGKTAQYAWFFIAYTLLNAVFYTANNIEAEKKGREIEQGKLKLEREHRRFQTIVFILCIIVVILGAIYILYRHTRAI